MKVLGFQIPYGERDFFLSVPQGARFLKVGTEDIEPELFFLVPDPDAPKGDVMMFAVPTGSEMSELEAQAVYLGSYVETAPGEVRTIHLFLEKSNA